MRRDKKVTTGQDLAVTLDEQVRAELLAVRKTASGVTPAAITACPTVVALLGGGDPGLAYNQLKTRLLDEDYGIEIIAAMASLGFTSDKTTHLGRLEDFGAEWSYDQRQARRYSDKGIRELAVLIATRWADHGAPELNVTVLSLDSEVVELHVSTRQLDTVEMRPVVSRVRVDDAERELELTFAAGADGAGRTVSNTEAPISLKIDRGATSMTFVWRGELWPKFAVTVGSSALRDMMVETLGAKLMLRW